MHLRRLIAEDASDFLALRLLGLQESPTAFGSSHEEERDRTPEQTVTLLVGSPERFVFGAFAEGRLVGIVGVGREGGLKERHRGFVRSMYVSPAMRGQGLGKRLLQQAIDVADSWSGIRQLTLAVTASNETAVALYAKFGFVEYGRAPQALCVAGTYYDEIQMVRHQRAA